MSGETLMWTGIVIAIAALASVGMLGSAAWIHRIGRQPGPGGAPDARQRMETLAEAIARLDRRGYSDSFRAEGSRLRALQAARAFDPEQLRIEEIVRFEGESDPDDESILFAIRDATARVKGTVATSFGPNADPALAELVQRIPDAGANARLRPVAVVALLALVIGVGLAPEARAEASTEVDRIERVDGDVRSVDPASRSFVVNTPNGPERFVWTERTRFVDAQGEAEEAELAAGITVAVQAMREGDERGVVDVLRIIDPSELAAGVVISDLGEYPAFAVADTVTVTAYHPKTGVLSVETRDGPRAFRVTDATRIRSGAGTLAPADLVAGQRIAISARLVADDITVVDEGSEPTAQAPPQAPR